MITNKSKKNKKNFIIATISVVVVLGAIGLCMSFLYHPKSTDTNKESTTTKSNTTNNTGSISSPKSDNPAPTTTTLSPDITPSIPTGTFVSNHRPNLSGQPAPNVESSTCTTTPGATCKISFTKDSITKSLPIKTTDSNGNIVWDWTLQDIGLTAGEWEIEAVAINGDQTTTASDSILLNIQP